LYFFFFQAEDGIRDRNVTGVQTCALPIWEHNIDDFTDKDNLIIKGNNLVALYSLKERYENKIKMIYIDPPYNTGNDSFKYNDKFNRSTWLIFMKNRLEIAFNLLKEDGVIVVQSDSNENHYLKVLCDEIFGTEK